MAEKLDPKEIVTLEELAISNMWVIDALAMATSCWSQLNPSRNPPTICPMPTPDSTPFTDAPFALKALWHKFTLGGELDPHSPPATVQDAYTQVVEIQVRQMRDVMQEINND